MGRSRRVEDDRNFVVEQEVEYTETCVPKGRVALIAIIGILLALLLLILAIIMILWEDGYFDRRRSGTEEPVTVGSTTTLPGSTITVPTVTTSLGPLTTTTTMSTTSTEEPCIDYEPYLCDIAWYEWLCDTKFGQSQCCWTCYVGPDCRDVVEGCHKVLLYDQCDNPRYKQECCATCVYAEP